MQCNRINAVSFARAKSLRFLINYRSRYYICEISYGCQCGLAHLIITKKPFPNACLKIDGYIFESDLANQTCSKCKKKMYTCSCHKRHYEYNYMIKKKAAMFHKHFDYGEHDYSITKADKI